jgi:hypothetical protein
MAHVPSDSYVYFHRSNADGTFDSICPGCFLTVSTRHQEKDLVAWSQSLVATVNLMLHSPFRTILSWGPEMVFLFNDQAVPTLAGKHP